MRQVDKLKNFLKSFSEIFPNKKVILVNVRNVENSLELKKEFRVDKNLKVIEYYFRDVHINGEDPVKNPHSWIGNETKWLEVIQDLKEGKIK